MTFRKTTREAKVLLPATGLAIYLLGFVILPQGAKYIAPVLAVFPIAAIGWTMGLRAAMLTTVIIIPLNTILLNLAGYPGWDVMLRYEGRYVIGTASLFLVGAAIGRLRDMWIRLEQETSEHQRSERALREAENEFALMKNELILGTSHGLRNPLHTLKGFLELISNGKVDDPCLKEEFLARALQDVDRMGAMLDNLLEMTQLQTGEFEITVNQIDLSMLVQDLLRSLEGTALLNGVTLKHAFPKKFPRVLGSRHRLRQAIANLVDNAIKFSEPGGVVSVTGMMMTEGSVLIRVIDQGEGIPKESLPSIFDKFYGLDSTARSSNAGPGLGLYTSKKIIEAHGGRFEVESEPRKGSTFYFSLPLPIPRR